MIEQNRRSKISQRAALAVAQYTGWEIEVKEPLPNKCVIIGAHHTSGADLLVTFLLTTTLNVKFNWVGKDSLFKGPQGWLLRKTGGVPVNRRQSTNFVERMINLFQQQEVMRLAIIPEGTRRKTNHWKTGFYHIATAVQVPIVMGFGDYNRKVVGLGPSFTPSGDIQADMQLIREFYTNVTGRYPGQQSDVRLRE